MDPLIEYVFGPGDGTLSRWSSAADLDLDADGTLDAVSIDSVSYTHLTLPTKRIV